MFVDSILGFSRRRNETVMDFARHKKMLNTSLHTLHPPANPFSTPLLSPLLRSNFTESSGVGKSIW